ncbi:helix-turn-helix domain-containing protein [uncultured Roseibium sp.]|uniref:GlxA family transcriptional regulator n=1 Tax=uncultured Roseibium sp. TaxID=1936171 RepID=UPI0026321E48|nr:helix-turn-helix domain-containing protein [uncultured Roseibium sp.]
MTKGFRFAILAYPGAMQSAVLGLQDILAFASETSTEKLQISVLTDFEILSGGYDAVILPPSIDEVKVEQVPQLPPFLKRMHEKGAVVCSACTGLSFVLAADLDGGRTVTTHWGLEQRLKSSHPELRLDTGAILVEYTDLITAGGLMAWIDLALALIERFLGYSVAAQTARHFIVEFRRRDQRRFRRFVPELRHGDGAILKAQHLLDRLACEDVTVAIAARSSGLSDRTFLRRFKSATGYSPKAYLQELRIERARDLLIETDKSIAEICYAVGYNDPPSFVRLFARLCGLPPGGFREHFK